MSPEHGTIRRIDGVSGDDLGFAVQIQVRHESLRRSPEAAVPRGAGPEDVTRRSVEYLTANCDFRRRTPEDVGDGRRSHDRIDLEDGASPLQRPGVREGDEPRAGIVLGDDI